MKVLIVDDDLTHLKILRIALAAERAFVLDAQNGVEALDILSRESVDAIISDILMPRMDGYRLCYEVRRNKRLQSIPFIFHTATYTSPSDEKLCFDLGADAYLRKPAPAKAVWAALTEALQREGRSPRKTAAPTRASGVMKEYSERLVCKLKAKNVDLAQAKDRLEEANRQLIHRTEELERARAELREINRQLDDRVRQRTKELEASNLELEAFSYSVCHDLGAPLRQIGGYANLILRNGAEQLNETGRRHLNLIDKAARNMGGIIEALLELTRVTHSEIQRAQVDLSALAGEVFAELRERAPERIVEMEVTPNLRARGDPRLLRIALVNLLGNALKFTSKKADARIEFGRVETDNVPAYFIRDNGAGFDMSSAEKLFGAFQRLHSQAEFQGAGIGLATVQRIVHRHNGRAWAEAVQGRGATFYFTLGRGHANDAGSHLKQHEIEP